MATHATTNTAVDDVFATWINKKFIADLEFELQHLKFCADAVIPDGYGANIAQFVDFTPPGRTGYASGSTALSEGTLTGNEITSITTTPTAITVAEYGEFLKITQLYELAAVSTTRARLEKRCLDGGAVSIDAVVRAAAVQSSNVVYALGVGQANYALGGTTTAPATVGTASAAMLVFCRKVLYDGLATGIKGVAGHPDGKYAAVITPKQELDIVTEITTNRIVWTNCVVNVPGITGQGAFVNGYLGTIYGVACYTTQNYQTQTLTSACDVGFVYAQDGVAAVSFGQMQPKIIVNEVNSPYKNLNTIAWHAYFGSKLVSSTRVVKFYSLS